MKIFPLFSVLLLLSSLTHQVNAAVEQSFEETKNNFLEAVYTGAIETVAEMLTTITPELLNAQDDESLYTALHIAVEKNNLPMVQLLLTKHKMIALLAKTTDGETAFDIARRLGLVTISSELLKYDVTQSIFDISTFISSTQEKTNDPDQEENLDSESEDEQKPQEAISSSRSWCTIS